MALRSSHSGELILTHYAFLAVQLTFYAVLQNAGRLGQQTDDSEGSPNRTLLVAIG
jgi:hypothetical protein